MMNDTIPTVRMRRVYNKESYCISHLFYGDTKEYLCDAIENPVRDFNHNGVFDQGEKKIAGKTAIPCGRYYVTFEATSLGIGKKALNGRIPLLHKVPSFTLIRIHPGFSVRSTKGCIILGYNRIPGKVLHSESCCLKFYERMNYSPFWLEITDDFA